MLMPEVEHKTYVDWYSVLREVCSDALKRNPANINAYVVEIDESLFGKK